MGQFESSKDKVTAALAKYTSSVEKCFFSQEEEEAEDSADRLVIDESNEPVDARNRSDNNSDVGDEVPQCQGCNQRPAQFVCAGCGNQWYCSRDCQVIITGIGEGPEVTFSCCRFLLGMNIRRCALVEFVLPQGKCT